MTWETVTLGDVAEINPRDLKPDSAVSISFVGMADLDQVAARTRNELIRPFGEVSSGYTQFRSGDLLAAKITPCWENGKIGEASISLSIGVGSTEFHVIRPSNALDPRFALHFIRLSRVRDMGGLRMTGSGGQRRVPVKFFTDLEIPLPPVEEQRRIAAILDQVDEIRAKRRAQLKLLDELPQSLFHEMFGKVSDTLNFAEVIDETRYGTSNKSQEFGTPALRIPNIVNGYLDLRSMKNVPVSSSEFTRLRLQSGDLLFVRSNGNVDAVGRCAVFDESFVKARGFDSDDFVYASYLIRVRLTSGNPIFISEFMATGSGRQQLRERSKTSAGQFNLNSTNLSTVRLPRATEDKQNVFAEKVVAIRVERERVARALEADEELFAALQYRAFRGEL